MCYPTDAEGFVQLRDGTKCPERWACRCQYCQAHGPEMADERYSFGVYAGKYCDVGWKNSGYIDADESAFDPDYCGERLEADY